MAAAVPAVPPAAPACRLTAGTHCSIAPRGPGRPPRPHQQHRGPCRTQPACAGQLGIQAGACSAQKAQHPQHVHAVQARRSRGRFNRSGILLGVSSTQCVDLQHLDHRTTCPVHTVGAECSGAFAWRQQLLLLALPLTNQPNTIPHQQLQTRTAACACPPRVQQHRLGARHSQRALGSDLRSQLHHCFHQLRGAAVGLTDQSQHGSLSSGQVPGRQRQLGCSACRKGEVR